MSVKLLFVWNASCIGGDLVCAPLPPHASLLSDHLELCVQRAWSQRGSTENVSNVLLVAVFFGL